MNIRCSLGSARGTVLGRVYETTLDRPVVSDRRPRVSEGPSGSLVSFLCPCSLEQHLGLGPTCADEHIGLDSKKVTNMKKDVV